MCAAYKLLGLVSISARGRNGGCSSTMQLWFSFFNAELVLAFRPAPFFRQGSRSYEAGLRGLFLTLGAHCELKNGKRYDFK